MEFFMHNSPIITLRYLEHSSLYKLLIGILSNTFSLIIGSLTPTCTFLSSFIYNFNWCSLKPLKSNILSIFRIFALPFIISEKSLCISTRSLLNILHSKEISPYLQLCNRVCVWITLALSVLTFLYESIIL